MQFSKDFSDQIINIVSFKPEDKEINIFNNNTKKKEIYTQSLLVFTDKTIPNWQPQCIEDLSKNDLEIIITHQPEIILLGIGNKLEQIDYSVLEPVYLSKIPFEVMTTINACRTFNLLAGEQRKVIAGLIL